MSNRGEGSVLTLFLLLSFSMVNSSQQILNHQGEVIQPSPRLKFNPTVLQFPGTNLTLKLFVGPTMNEFNRL